MDKFGLLNILNKLQVNEKQSTALKNLLTAFLNANTPNPSDKTIEKGESPKPIEPPPYFKSDAILNVIKKHDLLSKQIDINNKKH